VETVKYVKGVETVKYAKEVEAVKSAKVKYVEEVEDVETSEPEQPLESVSYITYPREHRSDEKLGLVGVFVRSYQKDIAMIPWLLSSLDRFFPQRNETVIVVPLEDEETLRQLTLNFDVKIFGIRELFPGWLEQNLNKLHADEYVSSEYILIIDADTFISRAISQSDLFSVNDGLPRFIYAKDEYYDPLLYDASVMIYINNWLAGAKLAWNSDINPDRLFFMATHPILFHRSTFLLARNLIETGHNMTVVSFVNTSVLPTLPFHRGGTCRGNIPNCRFGFSEVHLLGEAAHAKQLELYHWEVATKVPTFGRDFVENTQMNVLKGIDDSGAFTASGNKILRMIANTLQNGGRQ
jgi:hypothetical protein